MAEGVCSGKRARIIIIALLIVSIIAAFIAVIVYFANRDSENEQDVPLRIYRLPSALRPLSYTLELIPDIYQKDPALFSMPGSVVIRVLCLEPTSVIILHAVGLQISRGGMTVRPAVLKGDNDPLPKVTSWEVDVQKETLSLHLDASLEKNLAYDIHLAFVAPLTERFQAAYYSTYQEKGLTKYLAATIFVPTYARMAFPCFDEPAMKAEFTLTVLRKPDFIALSNMPRINSTDREMEGELWQADTFQKTPFMSTYLLTFTVCQFMSQQANTTRGYIFKTWSRAESVQQTSYALEVGTKIMPFFDDYFDIAFPLPEQEMIALPEYQYGGMEHWGLVGYRERTLLYSDDVPSSNDRQDIATIIAHELGHMWFGDLLTMKWWDDAWLNEGFATYVQYLGIDFAFPKWKMLDQFLVLSFRVAMSIDAFEQSRPLYKAVLFPPDALAAYDRIIYFKGASVIRMVKFFMGESTFKRGIQKYLDKYKYASATHQDLWRALDEETIRDNIAVNVSDVMTSWTLQKNFPLVTVTKSGASHVTVSQQRFLLKGASSADGDSYQWDIPFTIDTSSTHRPDQDPLPSDVKWLSRHHKQTKISLPASAGLDQWVLGNIGCYGYYRVNYEESNWRALIRQLNSDHQVIGVTNRVQILMDSWSLAKAGLLSYSIALDTLGYLQNETRYLPWRAALTELQELMYILSANSTVYQLFSEFMQKQTSSIFENFDPNTALLEDLDARTPMLVARSACIYGLAACVDVAKAHFSTWLSQPANNTMTVDLRSTFYCTALAHGNRDDWDFVFNQYLQQSTPKERDRLLMALTCSRNPETLNTLIQWTLDPKYIRGQDAIETLIACSANPAGRDLVWNFVRDNILVIKDRFGTTAFNMKNLFSGITQSFHTQKHLRRLEDLASKHPDLEESMTDAMEKTRANMEWVEANMATLEQWLRQQTSQVTSG